MKLSRIEMLKEMDDRKASILSDVLPIINLFPKNIRKRHLESFKRVQNLSTDKIIYAQFVIDRWVTLSKIWINTGVWKSTKQSRQLDQPILLSCFI
jgi:hypothetical protein